MARVGPHVNRVYPAAKGGGLADHLRAALAVAEEEGLAPRAAAAFFMGPGDRTMHVSAAEARRVRDVVETRRLALLVHSAYVNSNPWRGDPTAAAAIQEELRVCAEAGAAGLVVHLPVGPPEWVARFAPRLKSKGNVAGAPPPRVYLEHVACAPERSHYETPEKIAALFRQIRKETDPELKAFGFCMDTAHLWACGVDIGSYAKAEAWLAALEAEADAIPPERIAIHLNDNRWELGAGRDEHAPLLGGAIWSKYKTAPEKSGLAAFVDYANRHGTIVILERKPPEALPGDYRVLLRLAPALGEKQPAAKTETPRAESLEPANPKDEAKD